MLLVGAGGLATFSYAYNEASKELPNLEDYSSAELAQTSTVYDSEGNVINELYGAQNRSVVSMNEIDPSLGNAVVSIEDHRFYEHRGLDFESIARAVRENVTSMSIQEGGSTITQQLMKNTFIDQDQRAIASFQRKITEAALAWQYEKDYSKKEILEQYLNTVYFGANAYGAEAAAKTYFNKSAEELTIAESAMLAGIVNLPGAYDPFADPESARIRRDIVLDRMLQYGHISEAEHAEAVASDLGLSRGRQAEPDRENEYFLDAVRQELAREYGDDMIYQGGLDIYTTLDPELQQMASESVDGTVNPEEGDPSASLVSVDPATGAVKAMVGGSDFEQIKFNLATQGQRQPGSLFKVFVLAAAVKAGVSPDTEYTSRDITIDMPPDAGEDYYRVANYAGIERGEISVEKALEDSDNTVFMQLAIDLGLERVVEMAKEMGIQSPLDPYPSTAIGGIREGLSPTEMASAYSTLANSGMHMKPFLVQKVTRQEDGGDTVTVKDHKLQGDRVLSKDEAATVTRVMRGVVTEGTASMFHDLDDEIGRPSVAKTGTTEAFVDAWFVGSIPQLTTSVWVGYPEERTSMVNIRGYQQINGENFPLDIWSDYMQKAVSEYPEVRQFDTPSPDLELKKEKPEKDKKGGTTGETTTSPEDEYRVLPAPPGYKPDSSAKPIIVPGENGQQTVIQPSAPPLAEQQPDDAPSAAPPPSSTATPGAGSSGQRSPAAPQTPAPQPATPTPAVPSPSAAPGGSGGQQPAATPAPQPAFPQQSPQQPASSRRQLPPSSETPASGSPNSGTPSSGTPSSGTPSSGTPSSGTPSSGTPSSAPGRNASNTPSNN